MVNLNGKVESKRVLAGGIFRSDSKLSTYESLPDKPLINDVVLVGSKNSSQLNLQDKMQRVTNSDIENMFK